MTLNFSQITFPIALGLSLFFHAALFFSSAIAPEVTQQRTLNEIEVNYIKVKPTRLFLRKELPKDSLLKDNDLTVPGQSLILSEKDQIPVKGIFSDENQPKDLFLKSRNSISKPPIPKSDFIGKRTITLSALELDVSLAKPLGPAYLTYNNFLHERIRHCLDVKYANVHEKGLVCLRFAVSAEGILLEYRIVEEKTKANERLKRIAVESLKDASPFPRFPKEWGISTLTYGVNIHFIEDKE